MKIRLHQLFGAHTGRDYEFGPDRSRLTIGREYGSDIEFHPHADIDASGRHAELRFQHNRWVIADVGSRNGTYVNGILIREQVLKEGDELEFGPGGPRLRVSLGDGLHAPPPPQAPQQGSQGYTNAAGPSGAFSAQQRPPSQFPPAQPSPSAQPSQAAPYGVDPGAFTSLPPTGSSRPETRPNQAAVAPVVAPKQYGSRTVGFMMAEANKGKKQLKIMVGILGVLLVAVCAILVGYVALRKGAPDAHQIRVHYGGSVYSVESRTAEGLATPRCSAFAVQPQLLVTSASCVVVLTARRAAGDQLFARNDRNELQIGSLLRHPAFNEPTQDGVLVTFANVGLLQISSGQASPLRLSPIEALRSLDEGDSLASLGFVGTSAAISGLTISRVQRTTEGTEFTYGETASLGAPVFDSEGLVVGLHITSHRDHEPELTGPGAAIGTDAIQALLDGYSSQ